MSNTEPAPGDPRPPEEPRPAPDQESQAPPLPGEPLPPRQRGGRGLLNASGWTLLLWALIILTVLILLSQCNLFGD
jgi:hypothetical protein